MKKNFRYTVDDLPVNFQEFTCILGFCKSHKKQLDYIHANVQNYDVSNLLNSVVRHYRLGTLEDFKAQFNEYCAEVGYAKNK